jgi:hypothetical protein
MQTLQRQLPQSLSPWYQRGVEKGKTIDIKVTFDKAQLVEEPECDEVVVADWNTEYFQVFGSRVFPFRQPSGMPASAQRERKTAFR